MGVEDSIRYVFFGTELNQILTRNLDFLLTDSCSPNSTARVYLKLRDTFSSALELVYPGRLQIEDSSKLLGLSRSERAVALSSGAQIVVCVSPRTSLHPHYDRALRRYLKTARPVSPWPDPPVAFGWSNLIISERLPKTVPPKSGVAVALRVDA